ncbi:MAG: hypothetical protein SV186_06505 [Candidatus Nanohaloarchaea archaeon]|nr:hypothetical protein [Candidatus Nanohaloarchaea archaeon]
MTGLYEELRQADDLDLDTVKEEAEEIGGGMTNAVYRLDEEAVPEDWQEDDGVILKEYDDDPGLSLAVTHYGRLRDNLDAAGDVVDAIRGDGSLREALDGFDLSMLDYVSTGERHRNEAAAIEELADVELDVPDAVYADDDHMAFEEVTEMTPLPEYVEDVDLEEAYETAREVGELTAAMHEEGVVKMDNRLENVLVTDDGYASIDWEYTITDADDWDKAADVITFVSSAKLLDRETYTAVRDGFEDGYMDGDGEPLEEYQKGFTVLTSTLHPGAEAVKEGTYRESAGDAVNAVYNNVKDGLDRLR